MEQFDKIYIAGHRGLVGSALLRVLKEKGYTNQLTRTHAELDLTRQEAVERFFQTERPDYVVLAAAKVGGILANYNYPADFIYKNLMIEANIIQAAYGAGVKRLLFLGSSCIFPKMAPQPLKEEYLLTGLLEPTNEPYAIAKIAGIGMCESYNRQYGTRFLAVMPTNLYGPKDNFNLETSHVLPALIRKFHEAKLRSSSLGPGESKVSLWGTGSPRREFLHVDDMADACLFLMNLQDDGFDGLLGRFQAEQPVHYATNYPVDNLVGTLRYPLINIGCGEDITVRELSQLVAKVVGFEGVIVWDTSKPDGTPRKLLDVSRLKALGWQSKIGLEAGIKSTYDWFRQSGRINERSN
ncbi:MAG: GDP-L-fucose synthase [Thermodesulfobacteriota bacterium]|nr:GDP-L-fucose synthase [Thermodesulfobacteriota bacterium]